MKIANIIKRVRNSQRTPKQKFFFLHVPKCGGRSVEEGIGNLYKTINLRDDRNIVRQDSLRSAQVAKLFYNYNYKHGDSNDYFLRKYSQEHLAYLMFNPANKFISGHTPFSDLIYQEFSNTYCFITLIRDPINKWLSNYYYRKYRISDHWNINENLAQYLQTHRGKSHGYDYVKYFGGLRQDNNYTSTDSIALAKKNIHKFQLVGLLEDLTKFSTDFNKKFNFKLQIGKKNISPSKNRDEVTPQIIDQIKAVCKSDIEIYNYVTSNIYNP